jgi:hypothetical protein
LSQCLSQSLSVELLWSRPLVPLASIRDDVRAKLQPHVSVRADLSIENPAAAVNVVGCDRHVQQRLVNNGWTASQARPVLLAPADFINVSLRFRAAALSHSLLQQEAFNCAANIRRRRRIVIR